MLSPIAAFGGVALLGVLPGIAIAVALSILNVFRRARWPYDTELGRVDGLEGYHDIHSYPDARHLPGLVIWFAEMKDPVRQKIERYGLARKIEARHSGRHWRAAGGGPRPRRRDRTQKPASAAAPAAATASVVASPLRGTCSS